MVYVISGATGRTGTAAAQMLLDQGERVRVLVRNDAAAAAWAAKGAETAMADFTDAESMKTALTGAAGVYLMTPPLATSTDLLADRIPIETNMIEALLCHDVPKIVLLSAFAAHLDSGTGQIVGLRRMEQRFADAGLPFTALRAAFFAENWAPAFAAAADTGVLNSFVHPVDMTIEQVSTQDVGAAAVRALTDDAGGTRFVSVAGPAPVSAQDVALAMTQHLGKNIHAAELDSSKWHGIWQNIGWSEDRCRLYAAFFHSINDGTARVEPSDTLWRGVDGIDDVVTRLLG